MLKNQYRERSFAYWNETSRVLESVSILTKVVRRNFNLIKESYNLECDDVNACTLGVSYLRLNENSWPFVMVHRDGVP